MLQDISLASHNRIIVISLIGFQILKKSKTSRIYNNLFIVYIRFYYVNMKIPIPYIKSYMDTLLIWVLSVVNKLKMGGWPDDQRQLYEITPFIK
jgi:hypothetical protein